jgi:hypothetical protein
MKFFSSGLRARITSVVPMHDPKNVTQTYLVKFKLLEDKQISPSGFLEGGTFFFSFIRDY